MEDIDSMMIDRSKFMADGAKYFELFEKHVPTGLTGNILLMSIGNVDCLAKLMSLNKNAKYTVVENSRIIKCLSTLFNNELSIESIASNGLDLYNMIKRLGMKFDRIVMNPPYQRNLHLKILAEAIKHLKDDGTCVNLSPVLWLEDPHAHMKSKSNLVKFDNSIVNKCEQLDVVDKDTANQLFNTGLFANLGIYVCKKNAKGIDSKNFWKRNFEDWEIEVFDKVYALKTHIEDKCENNKRDGIRVPIAFIAGNRGTLPIYKDIAYVVDGMKDGKDWTKCKNNGGYEKKEGIPIPFSIKFNTENEAQNFYDSWKTTFSRWLSRRFLFDQHIQLQFLPWMENYTQPWDNARFYKFFNITSEEQKIIEETMEKYK